MGLNEVELRVQEEEGNSVTKLNPLEIESIVEKILFYLDLESLRAARLVSRLWNSEGIKILFKNYYISPPLGLYDREDAAGRKKKGCEKLKQQFQNFLSYNSFKIPHLSIYKKSDAAVLEIIYEQEEVQDVREVKSLGWFCDDSGQEIVLKNILYQLSNLNYLQTNKYFEYEWAKVIVDFCIATKTQNYPKFQLPLVLSRFHMECNISNNLSFIEDFENFSKCQGVRIHYFKVGSFLILKIYPHLQNRIIKIIRAFLWTNQSTLTKLKITDCEQFLSHMIFSQMPKLSKLSLSFNERRQNPALEIVHAFPQSFKFAHVTPNLKQISLSWSRDVNADATEKNNFWSTVFESAGTAPSVQKLVYKGHFTDGCKIDKLFQIFPNLQDFETSNFPNIESDLMSVWKYGKNLRHLYFKFQVVNAQAVEFSHFDRIITGFSQETVDRLNKSKSKSKDGKFESISSVELENLRVNPSILDLKGLKSVKMKLTFWRRTTDDDFPADILSVAGEFAFKLMPKVDFHIKIEVGAPNVLRTAVEKLSELPNVTFAEFEPPIE